MLFKWKGMHVPVTTEIVSIKDVKIDYERKIKFIYVVFDYMLAWGDQIQYIKGSYVKGSVSYVKHGNCFNKKTARSWAGCAPTITRRNIYKYMYMYMYMYMYIYSLIWSKRLSWYPGCVGCAQLRWLCAAGLAAHLPSHAEVYIFLLYIVNSQWLCGRNLCAQLRFRNGCA